jgi:anti-anti-sigma regulatory factor
MIIKIGLSRQRLGFSPDIIKLILEEFSKVENYDPQRNQLLIDFRKVTTISNLALMLIWKLTMRCKENGFKGTLILPKKEGKLQLSGRRFFDRLTGIKSPNQGSKTTKVDFETFRNPDDKVANQKETDLLKELAGGFLNKKNPFHGEVGTQILEMFANAFDHSRSKENAVCLCTLSPTGLLDFCVCDEGIGIRNSFVSNPIFANEYRKMKDVKIIEKATEFKTTCNPSEARNPSYKYSNGGIGLFFLRKFVELHGNSQLIIISQNGFFSCQSHGKIRSQDLEKPWGGTIVMLRTNINQDKSSAYQEIGGEYVNSIDDEDLFTIR